MMSDELVEFLKNAWAIDIKYHRDGTIRRIVIDVRDTTQCNEMMAERGALLIRQFVAEQDKMR